MFWNVKDFDAVAIELDFTSSGQRVCQSTAIISEGVTLINALDYVIVEGDSTQVLVCEECGISGCEYDGRVSFRRIGHHVLWVPAWDLIGPSIKDTWNGPPYYVRSKGAPMLTQAVWDRLRSLHPDFLAFEGLPILTAREAVLLWQSTAPHGLLSEYGSVSSLRRDMVVAVTTGELSVELNAVDHCLQEYYAAGNQKCELVETTNARPIEFWLDLPGTSGWTGYAHLEDRVTLFQGDFVLSYEGVG